MRTPLPRIPQIGDQEVLDVFAFYDLPRLFTSRGEHGLFLTVWGDEQAQRETWVIVPITQWMYQRIISGLAEFREVFLSSEWGFAYVIDYERQRETFTVEVTDTAKLSNNLLPAAGERVLQS